MKFQADQCRNILNINDARCRPCTGFDKTCRRRQENDTNQNGGKTHGKESRNRPV